MDCPAWDVIPSPDSGASDNSLSGVTALSASDAWAVGEYFTTKGFSRTLIEHWDGSKWSIVASPNAGQSDNILTGVTSVSANNVWAVGFYNFHRKSPARTLIEHWDGRQWSIVSNANAGPSDNILHAVTAVSANDIWTVGLYNTSDNSPLFTLIEHWNGAKWSVISSPNSDASSNGLAGVAAVSAKDTWAVGNYVPNGPNNQGKTLIEHWNGTGWSIIASPNVMASYNSLAAIAAISARDIWAVGNYNVTFRSPLFTLIEHWNGSRWNIIASPNPSSTYNSLTGVAATSANDVWAVGARNSRKGSQQEVLIEHWDGSKWSVVPGSNPSSTFNTLSGAAHIPGTGSTWAVGDYFNGSNGQTLTELGNACVS